MIVVPIAIAYGLCMPSTMTRSVTSCSGAADAMEVLANVELSEEETAAAVNEIGGCMVLDGRRLAMSATEDLLMSLERALGISTPQQIVASILSSKIAMGITHLLIDIPVGKTAKIRNMSEAMSLRKLFEYVGDMLSMKIDVIVTDGSEPVGNGIGPVLEARDVMKVLRCREDAPQDLREKALFMAGKVLEFDPQLRGGQGYYQARDILDSGRALEVMSQIVHAQGKQTPPPLGQLTRDITAETSGVVAEIDGQILNRIAMTAGAPADKGAGIDLMKKSAMKSNKAKSFTVFMPASRPRSLLPTVWPKGTAVIKSCRPALLISSGLLIRLFPLINHQALQRAGRTFLSARIYAVGTVQPADFAFAFPMRQHFLQRRFRQVKLNGNVF